MASISFVETEYNRDSFEGIYISDTVSRVYKFTCHSTYYDWPGRAEYIKFVKIHNFNTSSIGLRTKARWLSGYSTVIPVGGEIQFNLERDMNFVNYIDMAVGPKTQLSFRYNDEFNTLHIFVEYDENGPTASMFNMEVLCQDL